MTRRARNPRPVLSRLAVAAALALLTAALPGCRMPSASLQLIGGLNEVIGDLADGQAKVRDAALSQLAAQKDSLDTAFESDLRHLADPPAGTAPDAEPTLKLADVLQAKRLYDARHTEIQASREAVAETFDRLDNNAAAGLQMIGLLRNLVLQQNALAGQTTLALEAILKSQRK